MSPCPGDSPGARLHDGFFARSDTGLAFYRAIISGSEAAPRRSGIRGWGQGAGMSFGATPWPGVVVGGVVWTSRIDPVFVEDGETVSPDDDSIKITMLRLGPFVDFYPDPAGGFHALVEAAFTAQIETDAKGNPIEPAATGAALSFGAGYEWFLMDELSIGPFARLSIGNVVRSPPEGSQHFLWIIPELAVSATYH